MVVLCAMLVLLLLKRMHMRVVCMCLSTSLRVIGTQISLPGCMCVLGQTMFFYDPPDCLENLGAERAENSSKPGTGRFKKSIAGAELQPIKVSTRRRLQPLKRLSWLPRNGGYNEKRHTEACPTPECAP